MTEHVERPILEPDVHVREYHVPDQSVHDQVAIPGTKEKAWVVLFPKNFSRSKYLKPQSAFCPQGGQCISMTLLVLRRLSVPDTDVASTHSARLDMDKAMLIDPLHSKREHYSARRLLPKIVRYIAERTA